MPDSTHIVEFAGAKLSTYLQDENPLVSVKPICESLGLDWHSQTKRLKRNPILSDALVIMTGDDGQVVHALPLGYLNGWLFGVCASRVKPQYRDKLVKYQRECFQALFEYFYSEKPKPKPSLFDQLEDKLILMRTMAMTMPESVTKDYMLRTIDRERAMVRGAEKEQLEAL